MSQSNLLNDNFDEMDEVMSQIEFGETGENNWKNNSDGIDDAISQIDSHKMESRDYEDFDDMDEVMSQIDMNAIQDAYDLVDYCSESDFDDNDEEREAELLQYAEGNDAEELSETDMAQIDAFASQDNINRNDENGANNCVESDISEDVPADMLAEYQKALDQILPSKSASRYLQEYAKFRKWQELRKTSSFDEKVFMVYFSEAAEKYKPSTLWSIYSMLKKTLIYKHNVDISKISALIAFLKTKSDGFHSTKSSVFSAEEVQKFMVDAPNISYLGKKAVAAMGVVGGLRGGEMTNLTVDNVRDNGEEIVVIIPDTKSKDSKFFTMDGEMAAIVRQYSLLRPQNVPTKRFFLQYRNGKCTNQVMGKNSIAQVPKDVAKFLGLPNHMTFTGHGLRRTSTTILADTGAPMEAMRRHGPWKSNKVCEGYIQNSITYKRKTGRLISNAINLPSTSTGGATLAKVAKLTTSAKGDGGFDPPTDISVDIPPIDASNTKVTGVKEKSPLNESATFPEIISRSSSAIRTERLNVNSSSSFASSNDRAITSLPFSSEGNIIFHFSGNVSNFNVQMKQ